MSGDALLLRCRGSAGSRLLGRHFSAGWSVADANDELAVQIEHDGASQELHWGDGGRRVRKCFEDLVIGSLQLLLGDGPGSPRALTLRTAAPSVATGEREDPPTTAAGTIGAERRE
jgi:hypothetical protein